MVRKKEEYELVPEKKFIKLSEKVEEMSKNPLLKAKSTINLVHTLNDVNDSIISLLDVMKVLCDEVSFDEKEEQLIKKEFEPLIISVSKLQKMQEEFMKEQSHIHKTEMKVLQNQISTVTEQNETIANAMINIIDRMNDLQSSIEYIQKNVRPIPPSRVNPKLPPLAGGPKPDSIITSTMQSTQTNTSAQNSSIDNFTIPNLPPPPK